MSKNLITEFIVVFYLKFSEFLLKILQNSHFCFYNILFSPKDFRSFFVIIAIDGPAGSGKSSTAKAVAQKLGFQHLDTGAMYRLITLKALRKKVDYKDDAKMGDLTRNTKIEFDGIIPNVKVIMDGEDVSKEIRNDEVTKNVSDYCAVKIVRELLVEQQQNIAKTGNWVAEGRDMGSVVFPNADLKIYMVANVETRAKRRQKDFEKLGVQKSIEELMTEIETRDKKDSSRENSPLVKSEGAIEIDTSDLNFDEQVQKIVDLAKEKRG
jgi:cytidylate kinase